MKRMQWFTVLALLVGLTIGFTGCGKGDSAQGDGKPLPKFVLGWNVYPSSCVFPVAQELGLISGDPAKPGTLEKKHGVVLALKLADYDTLINLYSSKQVDAVTIVDFDSMAPALGRDTVNILPVSTSNGGDGCVATGSVPDLAALKGKTTYGLEKSVSQYLFERAITSKGLNLADYKFANMDPDAAAQAIQTNQKNVDAVVIWNPALYQTLKTRQDAHVLFDSSVIPGEIVDVIVTGKDSIQREGGEKFAALVCDVYYEVNRQLADPKTSDKVLKMLADKFLQNDPNGVETMKKLLVQTKFYGTPAEGIALYESQQFRTKTIPATLDFLTSHGALTQKPTVGFDDDKAQVNFPTKFMKAVK